MRATVLWLPAVASLALLCACPHPTRSIPIKDVSEPTAPPVLPAAAGAHARALVVRVYDCGDQMCLTFQVHPAQASLESVRMRCPLANGGESEWTTATLGDGRGWDQNVDLPTSCSREGAGELEIEMPSVCVDQQCESLRLQFDPRAVRELADWP